MSIDLQMGIFYALLAGTLWGLSPLFLKRGMALSNVSTATLVEQYVSVAVIALITAVQGELFAPGMSAKAFWAFVGAGAIGASFGKILYYKGIDKVGASKATSVKNSSPLLTVFLAAIFLGEELSLPVLAGSVLIVVGILILSRVEGRADERPNRLTYFFYPLMSALSYGINPVLKKIGMDAVNLPTLGALITQSTGLIGMLTGGRLLHIKPKWERVPTRSLIFFILAGGTEALGSLCTFYALRHAPAVLVTPLWRISPLITFLLARFTLRGIEVVTLRDGVAATFIVVGVFILSRG